MMEDTDRAVAAEEKPSEEAPQEVERTETELRVEFEKTQEKFRKGRIDFISKATNNEVNSDLIASWKKQHGEIASWNHQDRLYLYRSVKRKELSAIQEKHNDAGEQEVQLVSQCLLYPKLTATQLMTGPAMLPTSLAAKVMLLSGAPSEQDEAPLIL